MDAITLLVYTMRRKMYFTVNYQKSRHDEKRMKKISEDARKVIEELING